ncbi:MAG TPA: Rieske 2Fe-2S domain-containing protein [Streptosporangiaceae bacterium]
MLILLTADPVITRRVRQLADEHGLTVADPPDWTPDPQPAPGAAGGRTPVAAESGEAVLAGGVPPVAAVIDLLRPDALDRIRAWRACWPDTLIAGHIGVPDRELWVAAQRAGCDLVASRGALLPQLRDLLARSRDNRPERFPLCDVADAAGRLGLICRVDESPAGPLAVYRVAGRWRAIADRCPHAGAVLSAGEIDGAVVTCPGHGSRFDIRTGERLRGPADTDIEAFQLVQEGGQIYLPIRR